MTSINGLTNPFENAVMSLNENQLTKQKRLDDYSTAIERGYEPPLEILDAIAAIVAQDVLSPEDEAALAALLDDILADLAPIITSNGGGDTAAIDFEENSTEVVTTVVAEDRYGVEGDLTYSIVGGTNALLFDINALTGELTFLETPDYETNPGPFEVTVQVSDGGILIDLQTITVNLTDLNDTAPTITSNGGETTAAIMIAENSTVVTTVTSDDLDTVGSTIYSIVGGADDAAFTINAVTGELSFINAPDFEVPADFGSDNVYDVIVQVSDGIQTDTQDISVTVDDVLEAVVITSNNGGDTADISIQENTSVVTTVTSTDSNAVYSLAGGIDASLFRIDSITGELSFRRAPDYERPSATFTFDPFVFNRNSDNIYEVTVAVTDATGSIDTQDLSVSVTDDPFELPPINFNYTNYAGTLEVLVAGFPASDVELGDVDGDGDLDAILVNERSDTVLMTNNGGNQGGIEGTFTASLIGTDSSVNEGVAFGDFDRDGDLDAVAGRYLLINDGDGNFASTLLTNGTVRGISVGDIDGDGDRDLILARDGGSNEIFVNQGGLQHGTEGTFAGASLVGGNLRSCDVEFGDLDGDGDLDAIVANFNSRTQILTNDGSGNFALTATIADYGRGINVALGDIDGDGDLDAVLGHFGGVPDQLLTNQGGLQGGTEGTFAVSDLPGGISNTWNVAFADLDGDADLDIITTNSGTNYVMLNDGLGEFTATELGINGPWGLAVGDLDGDGIDPAVDAEGLPNIDQYGLLPDTDVLIFI